ncbi:MAG: AMP-binding protein [Treponema sp.]
MQTIKELGSYTFQAVLENSIKQFGDRPALSYVSAEPIRYTEVAEKITELQDILYRIGVNPGDKVALYSHSTPHWGIAYFAIVTMGAIAVPLLPDFSNKEVETCLAHAEAPVIITSEKLEPRVPASIPVLIDIKDFSIKRCGETREGTAPPYTCREEDTASIIYTSGTTGRSKGVELTHKNLVFTAIAGQHCQRINTYDCALSILPLSHVYEFTVGFLMFFLNGACVYYLEGMPTPRVLIPALQKVRPTMMLSVPIVIEKIYRNKILPAFTESPLRAKIYRTKWGKKILSRLAGKKLKKTFGGRLKFFGLGGSKTDATVEQFMKAAKFPYSIGYGLTETAPLVAGSAVHQTLPNWIGYAFPGVEIRIDNPDPSTGVGELLVKGPNVMKGYYRDPELTKAAFTQDGWFKTGDLFIMDKDGRLAIKGRSKNLILGASGENIYPEDIEFVLNQHPLVTESLVVEGEKSSLVAYVQLDEEKITAELKKAQSGTAAEPEGSAMQNIQTAVAGAVSGFTDALAYKRAELLNEIKFFVNANVNKISRIDRIEQVEAFEKTASQKIKRYLYNIANRGKKDTEDSAAE